MQIGTRRLRCRAALVTLPAICLLISGCAQYAPNPFGHASMGVHSRTHLSMRPAHDLASPIPPNVVLEDGLTEDEAAVMGLWNNAAFLELLTDLDLSRADLIEAGQLTNPQVQTMLPVGVKQWELALFVPLEALWVRPRRVVAAQLEMQRVTERVVQDGLNVVRDVRTAHANLIRANQRVELAQYGVQAHSENARRAESMVRAGAANALDVSPLRVNAMLAQRELIQAEQEAEVARQQLLMQLGIQGQNVSIQPVPQETVHYLDRSVDELVNQAVSSRADIQAAHLAIVANQQRANLSHYDYINFSGLLPDINSDGEKGFEAGPGLVMTLPIFNQNQGAKARAYARLEQSRRNFVTLRNTATLEVQQAHARFVRANRELQLLRKSMIPEATGAFRRMRKALSEDAVSTLLVMQTTDQYITSRRLEIEADAELQRAAAELERSVGWRLFHQSELRMERTVRQGSPPQIR